VSQSGFDQYIFRRQGGAFGRFEGEAWEASAALVVPLDDTFIILSPGFNAALSIPPILLVFFVSPQGGIIQ